MADVVLPQVEPDDGDDNGRQRQWRQRVGSASLSDVNLRSAMFYTARRPLT